MDIPMDILMSTHDWSRLMLSLILSKQDDFTNQISMLKKLIIEAGYECIFLPKFHCELNPIEMVSSILSTGVITDY